MKFKIKNIVAGIKQRLSYLSFKTGVVIMLLCVVCYIVSFAQMMLPWSVATKGLVWTMSRQKDWFGQYFSAWPKHSNTQPCSYSEPKD